MGIQEIKTALGDNVSLVDEVMSMMEVNQANVDKIGALETANHGLNTDIKSFKDMVRETTGLSELSRDNMTKLTSGADESLKADNLALQDKLSHTVDEMNGLSGKHELELNTMAMKDILRSLDMKEQVLGEAGLNDLTRALLEGATKDSKGFTFKKDGVTMTNDKGSPMSVEDRILDLRNDDRYYFFKQPSGGGAGDSKAPVNTKQQTKLQSAISGTIASMRSY